MRIVFFAHRYWPIVGGVEIYLQRLSAALLGMGHSVCVITGRSREDLLEREDHQGVEIHRFPALRSPWRSRVWLLKNIRLFRGSDVVHVSNTHMLEYLWRMVGPTIDRRKVFLTCHGMSYKHPVPKPEKRRAVRSQLLVNGTIHDGDFIRKWLGATPDLCPNQGLSPKADDLVAVPEPSPETATYIGRLEPDSGIRTYIDAVRILTMDKGRPFELRVFGDGSLAVKLRDLVETEHLPVRFFGRTANAQDFIAESCFAFLDGRMAIQEAMARRRLVLAAYGDPLKKDYVGSEPFSPFLIAVQDSAELVDRLEHFIEHPGERHNLIERAYQHARTLTWEHTAKAYVELWKRRLIEPQVGCTLSAFLRLVANLNREASRPKSTWANQARFARHRSGQPSLAGTAQTRQESQDPRHLRRQGNCGSRTL